MVNSVQITTRRHHPIQSAPDDQPRIIDPTSITSKESALSNANTLTGVIRADFGNDGPGKFCVPSNGGFSSTGAKANGNLTSGGSTVVVTANNAGTKYTGKVGSKTIFELSVNSNGAYTFKQYEPLDHKSSSNANEVINLNFDIVAKDSDGDIDVTTLTVRVQDTGPVAKNDAVTMWSCDWATIGNLITNYNQDNNGADIKSVEGPTKISTVSATGGETYGFSGGGKALAVSGKWGYFYIFEDGSYTYISWQNNPKSSDTETLNYTIVDGDGDVSSARLNVRVREVTETQNDASDYDGQDKTNTRINGKAGYKTKITGGAIVFGDDDNDVLAGNAGNDTIMGWKGNDTLYGFNGNDVIMGEHGSNTLYGGAGSDVFDIFGDKKNNGTHDTIMDFNLNQGDVLTLHQVIDGFKVNSDIEDFVRIRKVGGDAMIQVNSDGKGNDYYDVARIKNHGNININQLDVKDLFEKGHIDVY